MTMRVILKSGSEFAIKCDKFTITQNSFGQATGYNIEGITENKPVYLDRVPAGKTVPGNMFAPVAGAIIRAMKEQEERRERRVAHMEELTKEMAAIMRGLRRMNDREGKNERENANG